jgi:hypothetical protein
VLFVILVAVLAILLVLLLALCLLFPARRHFVERTTDGLELERTPAASEGNIVCTVDLLALLLIVYQ